jgi:glycosyltransferase involved in cell wall biosynthesis
MTIAPVLLVPAYQAADTIGEVVKDCLAVAERVVVVDDGSTDGTGEAARAAGAELLTQRENGGKGAALRRGFEHLLAEGVQWIATLDADGQHVPAEVAVLARAAEEQGADLVLGSRADLFDGMSKLRRNSNRISSGLISLIAGARLPDVQTGFRLYSAALLAETGFPEDGFEAESAVCVRAARGGYRIVAVPVRMAVVDGRGTSHYRALDDSLRIARAVWRARFRSGA